MSQPTQSQVPQQILSLAAVLESTSDSISGLRRKRIAGEFVTPIKIGKRRVGYPANEVAAINAARIAGKSTSEIKKLVTQLLAARTDQK